MRAAPDGPTIRRMGDTAAAVASEGSVRAITAQAGLLDGLRAGASITLAETSLASSVLGGQAIADSGQSVARRTMGVAEWLAVVAGVGVSVLTLEVPWSYPWRFELSAPASLGLSTTAVAPPREDSKRELAPRQEANFDPNRGDLTSLFWCFPRVVRFISVETILWRIDLGGRPAMRAEPSPPKDRRESEAEQGKTRSRPKWPTATKLGGLRNPLHPRDHGSPGCDRDAN